MFVNVCDCGWRVVGWLVVCILCVWLFVCAVVCVVLQFGAVVLCDRVCAVVCWVACGFV